MARRIADIPEDAEWPELEEELIPEHDPVPDAGGAFTRCYEYLHGARATLDADVIAPTRLLTVAAARTVLRTADAEGVEVPGDRREDFETYADGDVPEDQDGLIEALTRLTAFVETQVHEADEDA
jgi:hypothetical protein